MTSELRETICAVIFWGMAAIAGMGLVYPWRPGWPGARWLVHLPAVLPLLWLVYEMVMPVEMNIRIDLLLLIPGVSLALLVYGVKVVIFRKLRRNSNRDVADSLAR